MMTTTTTETTIREAPLGYGRPGTGWAIYRGDDRISDVYDTRADAEWALRVEVQRQAAAAERAAAAQCGRSAASRYSDGDEAALGCGPDRR